LLMWYLCHSFERACALQIGLPTRRSRDTRAKRGRTQRRTQAHTWAYRASAFGSFFSRAVSFTLVTFNCGANPSGRWGHAQVRYAEAAMHEA
jgi:hypothetical protein